jgi:hypothetical protein
MTRFIALVIMVFSLASLNGKEARESYVSQVTLANGAHVMVEEGPGEPRSIGSYTMRYYAAGNLKFPTDDFVAGIVRTRDVSVESLKASDLDNDGIEEIVVVIRSVGSGGYLQAEALHLKAGTLKVVASVADLPANSDPVSELRILIAGTGAVNSR